MSESDETPERNQDDDAKAWDAIVADLSGQLDLGPEFTPTPQPELSYLDHLDLEDAEGYVPPEPPPIPRPSDAIGHASWAAVLGGPALIVATNVLGWETWLSGVGVVAMIAGFISLVARMKDREDDGNNGAVV